MRYYLSSFFIHFLTVFVSVLFLSGPKVSHESLDEVVSVEMISVPALDQSAAGQPKTKTVLPSKSKKSFVTKKSSARATPVVKNDEELSEPGLEEAKNSNKNDSSRESQAVSLSYAQELKLYLEKNKHYPRQALRLKQTGVVLVKVKIRSNGAFHGSSIVKSSSSAILNQAALGLFAKLQNFKPLPEGLEDNSTFTIPISYVMVR